MITAVFYLWCFVFFVLVILVPRLYFDQEFVPHQNLKERLVAYLPLKTIKYL